MMNRVLIATHNLNKIKEFKQMLEPLGVEVLSAADLNLADVEETGTTFEENARLKAEAMSLETGLPCIADDSGLCVNALDGRPGVYTARYAPNRDFKRGREKLLDELKQSGNKDRSAYFICVIALAMPGGETYFFEGRVDGEIAFEERGDGGWHYDPVFIPQGFDKTFGEMSPAEKHEMSHRSRALQKFVEFIKTYEEHL